MSCNAESLGPIVPSLAEIEESVAKSWLRCFLFGHFLPLPGRSDECASGVPTASGDFVQSGLAR